MKKIWQNLYRILIYPAWLIFVFLISQLIIGGLIKVGQVFDIHISINQVVGNSLLTLGVYLLMILVLFFLPKPIANKRTTLKELGLNKWPAWRDILLAPLGLVIYYLLSGLLILCASYIVPGFDINQTQNTGFSNLNGQLEYLLAFVILVLIVPLAEEILFRGYLFGKMSHRNANVVSILITSLVFAVLHWAWNVSIDVFALSIIACVLRVTTGNIWAGVLLHSLKNGIAYFFLFIYPLISITLVR